MTYSHNNASMILCDSVEFWQEIENEVVYKCLRKTERVFAAQHDLLKESQDPLGFLQSVGAYVELFITGIRKCLPSSVQTLLLTASVHDAVKHRQAILSAALSVIAAAVLAQFPLLQLLLNLIGFSPAPIQGERFPLYWSAKIDRRAFLTCLQQYFDSSRT